MRVTPGRRRAAVVLRQVLTSDAAWFLLWAGVSSLLCVAMAARLGATFDEPFYIEAGLSTWRSGSNKPLTRAGTMPLPVDVQTAPLYAWERWRGRPVELAAEWEAALRWARAANLTFWWLLLWTGYRLGVAFGGRAAGRWAVALLACEPNLLAHAALATTDIAAAACLLLFLERYWAGRDGPWPRRVLVPGLCYGLALAAKASALVLGVVGLAVFGLWHGWRRPLVVPVERTVADRAGDGSPCSGQEGRGRWRPFWRRTRPLRRDAVQILLIGLVAAFAYVGCNWQAEPTFIRWAEQLPEGQWKQWMVPLSHQLRIFPNAGEALLYQIKHNVRGHGTYLLGEWYPRATPWYFPLAVTMKLPLAVAGLLLVVLLLVPRGLRTPPAALAAAILLLSPTFRVQIGIRFLLVAIALLLIALAIALGVAAMGAAAAEVPKRRRRLLGLAGCASLAGMLAATAWHWPHLLSYFNWAWGGPQARDDLLHESNYDWGQGLPELREWCKQHGVTDLPVWYYGKDPQVHRPPLRMAYLSHWPHDGETGRIRAWCGEAPLLAVSLGCLRCNPDITPQHRRMLEWLRHRSPVAQTRFFRIYVLREPPHGPARPQRQSRRPTPGGEQPSVEGLR